MGDDFILAEIRAMGIIYHRIAEPYYRITNRPVGTMHILDLNPYFDKMMAFLSTVATDPELLLTEYMWEDVESSEDPKYAALYDVGDQCEDLKNITMNVCQLVCSKFMSTFQRQLKDQLAGGKFSSPSAEVRNESTTVGLNNVRGESDFAILKRQRGFAPGGSTLMHETTLMWQKNNPNQYLKKLRESDPKEYERQLVVSKELGPKTLEREGENAKQQKEERVVALKQKQTQKEEKASSKAKSKQDLIDDIAKVCKNRADIEDLLQSVSSEKDKVQQLQLQLKYYKTVINDPGVDKSLFFFSHRGTKFSSPELRANLQTVLAHHANVLAGAKSTTVCTESSTAAIKSAPARRALVENLTASHLAQYRETVSGNAKSTKPDRKQKRPMPDVVGKRVRVRYKEGRKRKWFGGVVQRIADKENREHKAYDVQFDDGDFQTLELEDDWQQGDLQVL